MKIDFFSVFLAACDGPVQFQRIQNKFFNLEILTKDQQTKKGK